MIRLITQLFLTLKDCVFPSKFQLFQFQFAIIPDIYIYEMLYSLDFILK
jgi:hypothetical protein